RSWVGRRSEQNSTIVFPLPIDLIGPLLDSVKHNDGCSPTDIAAISWLNGSRGHWKKLPMRRPPILPTPHRPLRSDGPLGEPMDVHITTTRGAATHTIELDPPSPPRQRQSGACGGASTTGRRSRWCR